jgi:hypothetical protein
LLKRLAPAGMILAIACGGGSDSIGPTPVSPDISTMNVGEVRVLNPSDLTDGIQVPAGSGARDYLIIVGNTSPQHDLAANFLVNANVSSSGSFGISAAPDLSAPSNTLINQIPLARTPQQAVENTVRGFERSGLSLQSASSPLNGKFSTSRNLEIAAAAVPAVGDVLNLTVPNAQPGMNLCNDFYQTQAVVASVSATGHAIIAVDTLDGPPLTLFTQPVLDSIRQEFDNVTFTTDSSYFGNPTDIDNNGKHIILLFTGHVNELTPRGSSSFVGGFFFAGDFFPKTGANSNDHCAESNLAEIFYLLSPDPTGRFGDARQTSAVRQGTRGTIAHEFQHMINAGNRVQSNANSFESSWLDEGLAHFGEDAVGRAVRGMGDLQKFTSSDLPTCNSPCTAANDFNAFFFQNISRLTSWLVHPDKFSPLSEETDSLATRGAAWAFLRYAADNYSGGVPRALTRKLAAGPDTGVTNFSKATTASIDTLVKGWLVSMYADNLGIPGLDAKYQYRSYNFRSVIPPVARVASYPLPVQPLPSGTNTSGTNQSGTGAYYRLTVGPTDGARSVKILDFSGNPASFAGEHVYVLRVQ